MNARTCLLYCKPCCCWVTEGKGLRRVRGGEEKKIFPGGKEWGLVLKTSVVLLAGLCNVWKDAHPLPLAFG